jgi:hypothetical protein
MLAIFHLLWTVVANSFKSQRRLELENLFLRHQLNIALRRAPHRLRFRCSDRALMVWLTRLSPGLIGLARVVQPETILRWCIEQGFGPIGAGSLAVNRAGPK